MVKDAFITKVVPSFGNQMFMPLSEVGENGVESSNILKEINQ